ncbi:hypothetical protein [Fundidesulfovibrio agrisoli]|uniref:hypothetical protein n=1 Tax=Fundidesulfovibrio agrisoli TaxID=2922717 RepID=UPI001FABC129|nr:hypothetical protein [Fundidesulfovibrio agrisoli]
MFNLRLILLLGLFLALLVKGGQLCSAEGVQAMTRLVDLNRVEPVEPLPLSSPEDDFKGISPRPDLINDRAAPSKKVVKSLQGLNNRKQAQAKTASKDSGKDQTRDSGKDQGKKAQKKG